MPVLGPSPDGLALPQRRATAKKVKAAQSSKLSSLGKSYAGSSANTTKYSHPPKARPKPKPKPTKISPPRGLGGGSAGGYSGGAGGLVGGLTQTLAAMGMGGAGMPQMSDAELRRQAAAAVGLELDPEIGARKFAQQQETKDYDRQIAELAKQLGLSKGDISSLYSALDVNLTATGQRASAAYDTAKTQTKAQYDQLQAKTDASYTGANDQLTAELQRLGISGNPAAGERLSRDKEFLAGLNASRGASQQDLLTTLGTAAKGENSNLRGAAQSTAPLLIGQLQRSADQQKGELSATHSAALRKLAYEIQQLEGSRKGKTDQTLKALKDQLYQRQQDALQQSFSNQLQLGQLGISQGNLDVARTNASSTAAYHAQTLAQQAAAAAQKNAPQPVTGLEKAYQYLSQNYKVKNGVPLTKLQDALIDIINGNSNDPGYGSAPLGGAGQIPGYNPQYLDQYLRDLTQVVDPKKQGWSNAELSVLRQAIMRFFGK